jgi:hypothetical protein
MLAQWPLRHIVNITMATNEGLPSIFRTNRKKLVRNFKSILLGIDRPAIPIVFIRAPPYSGKTGLCQLLCESLQEDPKMSVVLTRGYIDRSVNETVKKETQCSLEDFIDHKGPRALIVDECQCTYADPHFWQIVKNKLAHGYPGLIIILAGSFGSLDADVQSNRFGTPVIFPADNRINLHDNYLPGLQLSREEFDEMIDNTPFMEIADEIWDFCDAHIGVVNTVLKRLQECIKSKQTLASKNDLLCYLYSDMMMNFIACQRGFPSLKVIENLISKGEISPQEATQIKAILGQVASGQLVYVTESPSVEVKFLLQRGFVFENNANNLCFASNLHLSAWINSYQRTPMPSLVEHDQFEQFIFTGISRMSTQRLRQTQTGNNNQLRERQIHMIFAEAILTLLPEHVKMIVEWRTEPHQGQSYGYVDIVILLDSDKNWFLELLVDGIQAKQHLNRFLQGGKYNHCLLPGCRYALIDFRQAKKVRKHRPQFVYVQFLDNFKKADLITDSSHQTIDLSP